MCHVSGVLVQLREAALLGPEAPLQAAFGAGLGLVGILGWRGAGSGDTGDIYNANNKNKLKTKQNQN